MTTKTPVQRPRLEKLKPERISHFTTVVDDDAMEYIQAVEAFKKAKRRSFPTLSEQLAILKSLGYRKP